MLTSILNLEGISLLSKEEEKAIQGGLHNVQCIVNQDSGACTGVGIVN